VFNQGDADVIHSWLTSARKSKHAMLDFLPFRTPCPVTSCFNDIKVEIGKPNRKPVGKSVEAIRFLFSALSFIFENSLLPIS
jgi:hypothetical protein